MKIIFLFLFVFISSCKNTIIDSKNDISNTITNIKKKSISQKLKENKQLSIKDQIVLYKKLKVEKPNEFNFENEDELTMYGYSFLWNNQKKEALEIFKLIVEQFPNSSNPYDSLGEAYMALGNMELSLINYQKSLELNPDNFNAEDQIEKIKNPNKKTISPAEKFTKIYAAKDYISDLDEMSKKLLEVHPNALKFISKEDFLALIERKKKLITNKTTFGNFIWHCSEIMASINCSHSDLGGFRQESLMLQKPFVFPVQTRFVNNQLFIVDVMSNANKVNLKDKIIEINNIPVTKIIEDIYKHIQSQGFVKTSKRHFFNIWSTEIIPYALGFPTSYQIKIKGKESLITLNKATAYKAPFEEPDIKKHKSDLNLEFKNDNKTAILTISSFNYYPWNNLTVFKDFIDKSFNEIHQKKIKNLIIDVRFNSGGSPESSIYLLSYLINNPFTYFTNELNALEKYSKNIYKGKLYFLIDGNGKSTTGHFMAIAKEHNLGPIFGEELGSNHLCTAGQTILRLKNTKLLYYVANTSSRLYNYNFADEKGVLPNFYVNQNIDDYFNKTDTVKEYLLNFINNEK